MSASSFTPQGSQTAAPSVVTPRSGHVTGHVTGGGMVVSGSTDDFSRFSAIPRKIPRSESTPVFSPQKMQGMVYIKKFKGLIIQYLWVGYSLKKHRLRSSIPSAPACKGGRLIFW